MLFVSGLAGAAEAAEVALATEVAVETAVVAEIAAVAAATVVVVVVEAVATIDAALPRPTAMAEVDEGAATLVHALARTLLVSMLCESPVATVIMPTEQLATPTPTHTVIFIRTARQEQEKVKKLFEQFSVSVCQLATQAHKYQAMLSFDLSLFHSHLHLSHVSHSLSLCDSLSFRILLFFSSYR